MTDEEVDMALVTISRGAFSKGKAVAERLAGELGYECVSREILLAAASSLSARHGR